MTERVVGVGRFIEAWWRRKRNSSAELWRRSSMAFLSAISVYHAINAQL
jgi:hypothetical protein